MESIPIEVATQIFENCSGQLKELCTVSKQFEESITTSSLMKNMPLVLRDNKLRNEHKTLMRSTRKYHTIVIRYDYHFSDNGMKILRKFSQSIRKLEIVRCIFNVNQFRKILEMLPNLESIRINATYLRNINDSDEIDIYVDNMIKTDKAIAPLSYDNLRNLRYVEIFKSDDDLIIYFLNSKLKSVKIEDRIFNTEMMRFLAVQTFLKEIFINTEITEEVLVIYSKMTQLEKVNISFEFAMLGKEAISADIQCLSVKTICLTDDGNYGTGNQSKFETILEIFPNVKTVEFEFYHHSTKDLIDYNYMKLKLGNLEQLSISDMSDCSSTHFLEKIRLERLTRFKYRGKTCEKNWTLFAQNNPNVKELVLKDDFESSMTDSIFTMFQHFKNLFSLKLHCAKYELGSVAFDVLCNPDEFKNLKVLKLKFNGKCCPKTDVYSIPLEYVKMLENRGILLYC